MNDIDYQDLFDKLGLSDLSEKEKSKRIAEMNEVLEQRIFLRIMSELSDENQKIFETIVKEDELDKFLEKNGIVPEKIAFEEATAYREELIQNMAYMMGKLDK